MADVMADAMRYSFNDDAAAFSGPYPCLLLLA